MRIPETTVVSLLDGAPVARLATLREDGSAAQVPIVFVRIDEAFWSPVDGKPKRSGALARLAHVERDPRVSLLVDHYDADWSALWWIRVEGRASVVELSESERVVLEGALRAKYPQYEATPPFRERPVALRIDPGEVRSWCASVPSEGWAQ